MRRLIAAALQWAHASLSDWHFDCAEVWEERKRRWKRRSRK